MLFGDSGMLTWSWRKVCFKAAHESVVHAAVWRRLSMDPAQRARILQLLPRMERPPGVEAEEWEELLLIEAPGLSRIRSAGSVRANLSFRVR